MRTHLKKNWYLLVLVLFGLFLLVSKYLLHVRDPWMPILAIVFVIYAVACAYLLGMHSLDGFDE